MSSKSKVKKWIFWLSFILVVINLLAFIIYQLSHSTETLYLQIWNYLSSDGFNVITVSIFFPIVLLLFEDLFNIGKILDERIQNEIREYNERRLKSIEDTSKLWNRIIQLCDKIIFLKPNSNSECIEEIIMKLRIIKQDLEYLSTLWYYRYPNLSEKDVNTLIFPIQVLLTSAISVAFFIRNNSNQQEISNLQTSLDRIENGILTVAHISSLNILNNSIYLTLINDTDKKLDAEMRIKNNLINMKDWNDFLLEMEAQYNEPFAAINDKEIENFRLEFKNIKFSIKKSPDEDIKKYSEQLKTISSGIPFEKFVHIKDVAYSKSYIEHLAREFTFKMTVLDLSEYQYLKKLKSRSI